MPNSNTLKKVWIHSASALDSNRDTGITPVASGLSPRWRLFTSVVALALLRVRQYDNSREKVTTGDQQPDIAEGIDRLVGASAK